VTIAGARRAVARLAEMAARPRLLLSIALGAACALVLAACGGGDEDVGEIPASSADVMLSALDDAQAAQESDPRDCETIANSASTVANEAAGLPDSPVQEAVIAAAENLDGLAKSEECGPTTTGDQGPEEDEGVAPETTPTTPPEETEPPPEEDDDNNGNRGSGRGGGRGGGGGNGNGPPQQPGNEGGGGLGQGNQGGQPPPDTGGTGGGGTGAG
jgi:uncharacterized membrane protein YgcG